MWTPQNDPLGIGLQAKARSRRFEQAAQGLTSPIGPLPDPQWDAYFEAINEAHPGKKVQFAQDPTTESPDLTHEPGYRDQNQAQMPLALPADYWTQMSSNQLGVPVPRRGRK